jgi:hypothetical protein
LRDNRDILGKEAMKAVRNWTSTKVPMWQDDMVNFWRAGSPFEIREVSTEEEKALITRFAQQHHLDLIERGKTLILTPTSK